MTRLITWPAYAVWAYIMYRIFEDSPVAAVGVVVVIAAFAFAIHPRR